MVNVLNCGYFWVSTRLYGIRSAWEIWISASSCRFGLRQYCAYNTVCWHYTFCQRWVFSSFSSSQLLWTSMPLADFVVCHGQARVRVTLPPNPLHPGHYPAVGWANFSATISLHHLFGLDFATGFPAVGGFADLSAHIRGSLFHRSMELPLGRARGVAYLGCAHIAILP